MKLNEFGGCIFFLIVTKCLLSIHESFKIINRITIQITFT